MFDFSFWRIGEAWNWTMRSETLESYEEEAAGRRNRIIRWQTSDPHPSTSLLLLSFFLSLSLSLSIYSTPFSFSFISFFRWCCFSVKYLPKGKRSSELVTALEFEVGGEERGGRREGGRKWRSYYAIGGESMWWRISACLFQCLFVSF